MERIVVVYERVSTDQQDISRQAVQRERAGAVHPEAELVVIQDDGVSAYTVSIFDRPGGGRLCAMVEAGEVEAIYTDETSRLVRNDEDWVMFASLCRAARTRIIIDGEEARHDFAGRLIGFFRAAAAQEESTNRSHRTRSGLREAARQGRYPVGQPPFGYRSVGSKREREFLVEQSEAVIVRRIFEEYVAGVGVNRIAARLNADSVRTRQGAKFSARSILAVLPNRTYLGEICLKGETLATGAHDPIIDAETFAQAERLRAAKRSRPNGGRGRPAKRHLLDGLLYCANGHRMLARRWGDTEYYACSRKHTYGDCDAPDANRRRVDETLLHHYLTRHFDQDEMRERLRSAATDKIAEAEALAAQADREEAEAEAALARIRRDYKAGKITADDWRAFQAELEEEQEASRASATRLRTRAGEIRAEAGQVDVEARLVARLGSLMEAAAGHGDDPEAVAELRAALTATFERIVYQPAWRDVPEGAPIVLGPAELAPVLRLDLMVEPDPYSGANAPSPPGRRDPPARRSETPGHRAGGAPRPRPVSLRARRPYA